MVNQQWTKELVQKHAQTAVAVELYTLPFYLTALSSINPNAKKYDLTKKDYDAQAAANAKGIYNTILSVCMEEMLHLQFAANLCRALDSSPNFTVPQYGIPIPFLDPDDPATAHNKLINAVLGGLNETTLQMMLDIETPSEFEPDSHETPNYPYRTLGQMYDALLKGIEVVGVDKFSWDTTYQKEIFTYDNYTKNDLQISQTISNLSEAQDAINLINEQGEGQPKKKGQPLPKLPYKEEDFLVPEKYRFMVYQHNGKDTDTEQYDPSTLNKYSHFGRFIWVQNQIKANGYPEVYSIKKSQDELGNVSGAAACYQLSTAFMDLIGTLNYMWSNSDADDTGDFWTLMPKLVQLPANCWKAGVIPQWSFAPSSNQSETVINNNIDFKWRSFFR